jgi:hypothetical protein
MHKCLCQNAFHAIRANYSFCLNLFESVYTACMHVASGSEFAVWDSQLIACMHELKHFFENLHDLACVF